MTPALQTCGCALSAHIVRRYRDPTINYVRMGPPISAGFGLLIRHYRHCAYGLYEEMLAYKTLNVAYDYK